MGLSLVVIKDNAAIATNNNQLMRWKMNFMSKRPEDDEQELPLSYVLTLIVVGALLLVKLFG